MLDGNSDNRLFKSLFEQAPLGIGIVSPKGEWIKVNQALGDLLGYNSQELIGLNFEDLTHPADITRDKKNMEALFHERVDKVNLIKRYFHKNGDIVWMNINANLVKDKNDNPRFFLVLYQDVTEIKHVKSALEESQEQFRMVVEKSPQPIIISTNEKVTYINPALTKSLGYTMKDISSVEKWFDLVHPDKTYREESFSIWKKHVLNEDFKHSGPNEYIVHTKSGEKRNIEVSMIYLGEKRYLYMLNDITDKKRIEEQKIRTQKLESLGSLAGGIAHDFNNILVGLLGNISLIKNSQQKLNPELMENIEDLEYSLENATNLTKQLLTFAKGGHPVKEYRSIEKIMASSIQLVMSGSKSKCEFIVEDDLPDLYVDPGQIQQVFNNLLINSSQAMETGGNITVKMCMIENSSFEALSGDKKYVKIDIQDEGVGIPKENEDKIFTPYFSTKGSSGLGLATAYSIINRHEGFIDFHSEEGVGTTFSVYLPVNEQKIQEEMVTDEQKASKKNPLEEKNRILILEDELMVQKVLQSMLKKLGQEPIMAKNGEKFLQKYEKLLDQEKKVDMIILDLTIPGGMGGIEVINELKKKTPRVNAIVSSGYSNDPVLSNYEKYGFRDVLKKPYTMAKLKKVLNRNL